MSDPFTVLGLPRDATEDQIKTAYRKLAMEFHPDRNQGDKAAEEKFKEISAAYETLKDPSSRAQAQHQARPRNGHFDFEFGHGPGGFTFEDIFGDIRPRPRKNPDIHVTCTLSLEEAMKGKEIEFNVPTATGAKKVQITVPPGVDTGSRLRVQGSGERHFQNLPAGDLYCTIHVLPHDRFHRIAQNLLFEHEITAFEAMLGSQFDVSTLDGQTVRVNIPAGVQPGQRLRVSGHGMPVLAADASIRGDLIIALAVKVPTNLTDEQKDLVRQAKEGMRA